MRRVSEWVSPGHPDKVADFIVSYLLDRYMERDPKVRYAMECQVKDGFVTLGGEVTSSCVMDGDEMRRHVRDAVCAIGYTPGYAAMWGAENCIDPDAIDLVAHVGAQSPDIAQGVDDGGWGDQGIFWGMSAGTEETALMPKDHYVARRIGMALYEAAKDCGTTKLGLDVKTQVAVTDGRVREVVVAVPTTDPEWASCYVADIADTVVMGLERDEGCVSDFTLTVNGTGAYVRHASAGDCGTTGRKLAVDFYGGNCPIGGGCPWGKDCTKADVTLNAYARKLAVVRRREDGLDGDVLCAIDCCIGRREIGITYRSSGSGVEIGRETRSMPARAVAAELGLDRPVYAGRCLEGQFYGIQAASAGLR